MSHHQDYCHHRYFMFRNEINNTRPLVGSAVVGGNSEKVDEVCHFSKESLAVLDSTSRTRSYNSLSSTTSSSEESAPGLTDCSSRSSLHDLDISIDDVGFDEFKDALSSPIQQQRYFKTIGETKRDALPYLPRVLRPQQPRSVSFSSTEEILGEHDDSTMQDKWEKVGSFPSPRTPTIHWYPSSAKAGSTNQFPPERLAFPPLSSAAPRRALPEPQLRPRRSALKKTDAGADVSPLDLYPSSPMVRWYASKK